MTEMALVREPMQLEPRVEPAIRTSLKLAYLLNQYPYITCTFIRREILALEEMGFAIQRIAIRPTEHQLVDVADLREQGRTSVILSSRAAGFARLVRSGIKMAISKPIRFAEALKLAIRAGRKGDRGVLVHLAYLLEACVAYDWCRDWEIEHIHCHFAANPATVALLCRVMGGPTYSFTVHGPQEFDLAHGASYDEKIARSKFVSTISSFAKSQIFRWCRHEDWSKVHIVRCGVDSAFLEASPFPMPPEPRLLNIGRLSEQKGQLLLVEAAALLKRRGVAFRLDLVGDGEMRGEIERSIAHHQLEKEVRLLGWQSEPQVRERIQQSRAVVLASFAEGLPVVLMEALAMGRPAISTTIAGVPELISDGETGYLVPAGSVEHLADAMQRVVEASVSELEEMGRRGRERVRRDHDVRTETRKLARLISRA